jgi:3-hydroxymyristoyl/3-hydroxydecanoyl-(acyl carrier protein) dehydratase
MNPANVSILDLLPQRPPMVMLDRLSFCEGVVARGELSIREENVFTCGGSFTESGMLEALAQTAAARTSLVQRSQAGAQGRPPQVGVIGSIKDFRLNFLPKTGDTIETEIELLHEFLNASVIRGRVLAGGAEACSAELKIFLTVSNPSS